LVFQKDVFRCHRTQFQSAKNHRSAAAAGAPPRTPLEELTALRRLPNCRELGKGKDEGEWKAKKAKEMVENGMRGGERAKEGESGPSSPSCVISGHQVGAVNRFTYLGSDVDSSGYCTPEILRRIGLASSIMSQLDRVWRQGRLSNTAKFNIYSSCVLSSLLYASETWTLFKADIAKLEAFHMTNQRRILGIFWYEFVTNVEVATLSQLPSINEAISRRRHSLFGHVRRMDQAAPAHQALDFCHVTTGLTAIWRRQPGRPPICWIEQVTTSTGLSPGAWSVATNRSAWRALRPVDGQAWRGNERVCGGEEISRKWIGKGG